MTTALDALTDPRHLRDESIRRLDRFLDTMLKVSTGTLVLSVTFRESVIGGEPVSLWLIVTAWLALGLVAILYCTIQVLYGVLFSELHACQLPVDASEKVSEQTLSICRRL